MHSTFFIASVTLLLASVGVASPASAGAKVEVMVRNLRDAAAKSDTNLARQTPGKWACNNPKIGACCDTSGWLEGLYLRPADEFPCTAQPATVGLTTYGACPQYQTPKCCNSVGTQAYDSIFGTTETYTTGKVCEGALSAPFTCPVAKKSLCCHTATLGTNLPNEIGCLGKAIVDTAGGLNLSDHCAPSKTAKCCTTAVSNTTASPNGNMVGTDCTPGGSAASFGY